MNSSGAKALTNRERQVLVLVAAGHRNSAIATLLKVKICTVESHVHSILLKLAVGSRLQAALWAVRELDLNNLE